MRKSSSTVSARRIATRIGRKSFEYRSYGKVSADMENASALARTLYTVEVDICYRNATQPVVEATHALSFCCTLLTPALLQTVSFADLNPEKDWFDVHISRISRSAGFHNYLLMNTPVLHRPHSSRPWKRLKYTNPLKYYFIKYFKRKDRI